MFTSMDVIFYWLLAALISAMALYFVIYGAVIAALRQYRRESRQSGAAVSNTE